VVNQLREIRQSNEDILFAYIIRRTKADPTKGEFVADSHSLNPYANVDDDPTNDVNLPPNDGPLDPYGKDLLQWPGQQYADMPLEALNGYKGPMTNDNFYEDQWGHLISGYAPIKDVNGNAVAVVAIDMEYSQLGKFNAQTFTPILYFLGFFLLFIFIRLFAFNRSLFKELWALSRRVKVRWYVPLILVALILSGWGVHFAFKQNAIRTVGLRMQSIAATAASDFSDLDLNSLRKAEDMKTETYQKVFRLLNEIRNKNPGVKYAYIFRPTKDPNILEFVVDADSNYFIPESGIDHNLDGKLDQSDMNVFAGSSYPASQAPGVVTVIKTKASSYDVGIDQWGSWISGFAPIFDKKGSMIGVLGVDFDIATL
jgi:hypothetical protein